MTSILSGISIVCFLCFFAVQAAAQPMPAPVRALTHHEQAAALNGTTKADKAAWMREQVRASRYGQRGLNNLFKGFEGKAYLDPEIPGVTKNLSALSSLSEQQAKGALRTLLYATKVYQHPRFQLTGVDQPVNAPYGRTDKDLAFRHRKTGQRARVEVKDVKPASQRADLERIKGQIDKMAAEYRRTGELQAWANRQETIPAIKEYARQKGVPTYENTKQTEFSRVLDDLDSRSVSEARVKLLSGSASAGLGVLLLYTSGNALFAELELSHDDIASRLRMGENASLFAGGGAMTTEGLAKLGSWGAAKWFVPSESTMALIGSAAKRAGQGAFWALVTAEGIAIARDVCLWEQMSEGKKYVALLKHGSNALLIAALKIKNPKIAIPMVVIGAAGHGVAYFVDKHYAGLEEEQKQQVRAFIYQHYGVSQ